MWFLCTWALFRNRRRWNDYKRALESGALGCGITGSGPSVFTISKEETKAKDVAFGFKSVISKLGIDYDIYMSKINLNGVKKMINVI